MAEIAEAEAKEAQEISSTRKKRSNSEAVMDDADDVEGSQAGSRAATVDDEYDLLVS